MSAFSPASLFGPLGCEQLCKRRPTWSGGPVTLFCSGCLGLTVRSAAGAVGVPLCTLYEFIILKQGKLIAQTNFMPVLCSSLKAWAPLQTACLLEHRAQLNWNTATRLRRTELLNFPFLGGACPELFRIQEKMEPRGPDLRFKAFG